MAQQHAVEVARLVGIGEQVERLVDVAADQLVADVTQRGEIFRGEADAVEQGHFAVVRAPLGLAGDDLPQLLDRIIAGKLLDFAFDAGLLGIFDECCR